MLKDGLQNEVWLWTWKLIEKVHMKFKKEKQKQTIEKLCSHLDEPWDHLNVMEIPATKILLPDPQLSLRSGIPFSKLSFTSRWQLKNPVFSDIPCVLEAMRILDHMSFYILMCWKYLMETHHHFQINFNTHIKIQQTRPTLL